MTTTAYTLLQQDQVDKISGLSQTQLELLGDVRILDSHVTRSNDLTTQPNVQVRDLYKEHVALEREFAVKLQQLARKAADKKSRKIAALVVGSEPTKPCDDSTIARR